MSPGQQAPEQGWSGEFTGESIEATSFDEQPSLRRIGLDSVSENPAATEMGHHWSVARSGTWQALAGVL